MTDPSSDFIRRPEFDSLQKHLDLQDAKVDHLAETQAEALGWMRGFAVALGITIPLFTGTFIFLVTRGG